MKKLNLFFIFFFALLIFRGNNCYGLDVPPKLSIIVPVNNTEKYLPECIDSILNQSWKDFELICIDDGSTDNSYRILKNYEKKNSNVKVVHQEKAGVSSARNLGIELARGEYITFVDSDDYLEMNAYETAFKKINNDDILVFGFRPFPEKNEWLESTGKVREMQFVNDSINAWFSSNANFVNWNKIYKSDLIKRSRVKFISDVKYGQDQCFNMMIYLDATKIHFIEDILYNYRTKREGSSTSTYKTDLKIQSYFRFAKEVCDFWENKGCLKGNEPLLLEKFTNMIIREINKSQYTYEDFDISLLDDRIYNKTIISKCSKEIQDKIEWLKNLSSRKNNIFDEIVSLGYNCEVSYRIQDAFGEANPFLYSRVYTKDDDLFIKSLDNMDDILSGDFTLLYNGSMALCDKYNILFHTKINKNKMISDLKKRDSVIQETCDELHCRKKHLTEKTKDLFNSDKRTLFVRKVKHKNNEHDKRFIEQLFAKLKKNYKSENFVLLIVFEEEYITPEIMSIESDKLKIRSIKKFADDAHTDFDGDLEGWKKIFSEFAHKGEIENA